MYKVHSTSQNKPGTSMFFNYVNIVFTQNEGVIICPIIGNCSCECNFSTNKVRC